MSDVNMSVEETRDMIVMICAIIMFCLNATNRAIAMLGSQPRIPPRKKVIRISQV